MTEFTDSFYKLFKKEPTISQPNVSDNSNRLQLVRYDVEPTKFNPVEFENIAEKQKLIKRINNLNRLVSLRGGDSVNRDDINLLASIEKFKMTGGNSYVGYCDGTQQCTDAYSPYEDVGSNACVGGLSQCFDNIIRGGSNKQMDFDQFNEIVKNHLKIKISKKMLQHFYKL